MKKKKEGKGKRYTYRVGRSGVEARRRRRRRRRGAFEGVFEPGPEVAAFETRHRGGGSVVGFVEVVVDGF